MTKSFWGRICFWTLFIVLVCGTECWSSSALLKIRHWADAEHTRIVLDLQGDSPIYETPEPTESTRFILTLKKVKLSRGRQEVPFKGGLVQKVTVVPRKAEEAEVVFTLVSPSRWNVFTLKGEGNKPDRLVVDFFKGEAKQAVQLPKKVEAQPKPEEPKKVQEPPTGVPEEAKAVPEEPRKPQAETKVEPAAIPQEIKEVPGPKVPEKSAEKDAGQTPGTRYKILEMRQWSAPDHTRVVVDLDGRPIYDILPSPDPLTWTLQLRNVIVPPGGKEVMGDDPIVRRARLLPRGGDKGEITVSVIRPARYDVFILEPYSDKPYRLVIDVYRPDLEEKEKTERRVSQQLKAQKKRIIVIDPGHGGEDPGAIGPKKTQEKDIALVISRKLQKALDESGDFRAFLTRKGDYFVPLRDRIKIAQEYGADLFISIHANASPRRQVRGTSVYCLSLKGASDTATQMLAQMENASDLIGGIGSAPTRRDLDTILLDLEQTHTINESLQLGGLILGELKNATYIQFPKPMQAGFAVLKAHNIPSILVETAHISHPIEEKFLKKDSFQTGIIQGLVNALKKFMPLLASNEDEMDSDRPKKSLGGGG